MNLTPGTRLGAYTIVSALGTGGMGEVYRARDSRLHREVAIKVLRDHDADLDALHRFALEARAVAALNHPNIVTIFDVSDDATLPYMAMELVAGETLRDRIARAPVPLAEALNIAVQIAEGLAHAHDAHIVHRDLKPQNVMLKADGLVKILDFGLGKRVAPHADGESAATTLSGQGTAIGTIVGTAGYMSPEQVTGRPVDQRSDQFAFGALLYELLTGKRAFDRDTTIETISSVLAGEPPPIRQVAPSTPASLVTIVERCLQKRPDDRYASTRDLVVDLQAIRRDLLGSRPSLRLQVPRRQIVYVVAGLLIVAVLAAVVALLVVRQPSAAVRQIAVLPFTNIQRDPSNDAFADGIVELLTTNLTQLERSSDTLRVVPASDVRRYGVASAKEARQTFGATLVVSGSIQRSADIIRLTLNLIDSATQQQRNARVIDARADNPLALQDQAFAVVAAMLGANVEPVTRATIRTGSTLVPGAYDFYVQGRGYLQRYERLENVDNAINLFQRAIEADQQFALAHASLGEALWRKYELTKDSSLIADARAACAKATAINDQTAAVHLTLSMIARGTGEYETAAAEAKRAIDLDPTASDGRRELARAYEALSQFDRAEATYKEAIERRPGDWSGYNVLGSFYFSQRRYDDALAQFRRVTELTPDNALGYSNLGGIQFALKRYESAQQNLERSISLRPTASALSNLGSLYFRAGRNRDASEAFEKALQIDGSDYRVWGNLGAVYRNIDSPKALPAFQKALTLAEKALADNPRQPRTVARLAGFAAAVGDRQRALLNLTKAMDMAPNDSDVWLQAAVTHEILGDRDEAIDAIQRAIAFGYPKSELKESRGLADLRDDARIRKLLQ